MSLLNIFGGNKSAAPPGAHINIFDWDEAARLIKKYHVGLAAVDLPGSIQFRYEPLFDYCGMPLEERPEGARYNSRWLTPCLALGIRINDVCPEDRSRIVYNKGYSIGLSCYTSEIEKPEWADGKAWWPKSALAILNDGCLGMETDRNIEELAKYTQYELEEANRAIRPSMNNSFFFITIGGELYIERYDHLGNTYTMHASERFDEAKIKLYMCLLKEAKAKYDIRRLCGARVKKIILYGISYRKYKEKARRVYEFTRSVCEKQLGDSVRGVHECV